MVSGKNRLVEEIDDPQADPSVMHRPGSLIRAQVICPIR
jgi:hypothetical protein